MADVFTLDDLIDWLECSDPETTYDYANNKDCLLARYGRSRGVKITSISRNGYWSDDEPGRPDHEYPHELDDIADSHPATYGAALGRAKELRDAR